MSETGPRGGRRRAQRRRLPAAVLSALLGLAAAAMGQTQAHDSHNSGVAADLPDAPSTVLAQNETQTETQKTGADEAGAQTGTSQGASQGKPSQNGQQQTAGARGHALLPCPNAGAHPGSPPPLQGPPPCQEENPIQPIVTSRYVKQLTSNEKGVLALRDFFDPFNFMTIAGYSAVAVAANSHSAYGPGFKGFGRLTGYSLATDAQGEFLETYAIPSLVREDPRYHRMPDATFKRRVWHAIAHTYVSQHDDGRPMPNYATLLTYPISAEISDRYVPGIQTDLPSTGRRVAIGIATDPAGALVAEFLPDVARRIHIHIVFVQEILNRMVVGSPTVQ